MLLLDVVQGENLWHEARAKYRRTASLAPAIMGSSKKKTRTDAIAYLATGIEKEFSAWVQENLIDRGHLIESYAKPLAEKVIGKKLYPVTAVSDDEYMLASYDGLSADDADAWECKSWNERKAKEVRAGIVPDEDLWQVVQQLAIGAKRCLYMVTDGTEERTEYCWLLREEVEGEIERLAAGWKQADKDVANYQHDEHITAAVAAPIKDLPAIIITSAGSLSVETNFRTWEIALRDFISKIPEKPSTDQEFADCKAAVAAFKKAEEALDAEETRVLSMVPSVDEMRRHKKLLRDLSSTTRLALEKLVVRRDIEIKNEIMQAGKDALAAHIADLNKRLSTAQMPPIFVNFAEAIKSKRNLENMRDAVATLVAAKKIESNEIADKIDVNIKTLDAAKEYNFLFNDRATLVMKAADDLALVISSRIAEHQQAEAAKAEAQRAEIQAEEERKATAKAQEEAEAILAAERAKLAAEEAPKAKAQEIFDEMTSMAELAAKPSHEVAQAAVIEHQDIIGKFMRSRDFGKTTNMIRAILVEFVKFQSTEKNGAV